MTNGAVTVSAVFITFNEEKNIGRAIDSVKGVADEIVVLDSGSSDATESIARSRGAAFHRREFEDFASQKNAAVALAGMDYVLVLDADEELSEPLRSWLVSFKSGGHSKFTDVSGFFLPRKSSFLGKWINHSGWFPDYTMRFFRRGSGRFNGVRVHESCGISGKTFRLPARLFMWHYTYDSLEQYFVKFNSYTTMAAADLFDRRLSPSAARMVVNPLFGFFKQYFIKLGFLDGFHGFVLAVVSAYYVFVKYAKHYFLCRGVGPSKRP